MVVVRQLEFRFAEGRRRRESSEVNQIGITLLVNNLSFNDRETLFSTERRRNFAIGVPYDSNEKVKITPFPSERKISKPPVYGQAGLDHYGHMDYTVIIGGKVETL